MAGRTILTGLLLAGFASVLAACGQRENDPGPGGVTIGEARALDEAAQMLEERRLPPEGLATSSAVQTTGAAE